MHLPLPNVCGPEVGESWVTCAVRQLCGPAAIVWMSSDPSSCSSEVRADVTLSHQAVMGIGEEGLSGLDIGTVGPPYQQHRLADHQSGQLGERLP
jgi:hypothetical protein